MNAAVFRSISAVQNLVTGELVTVNCDVHPDDLEWLRRLWDEFFDLEFRINIAERAAAGARTEETT